MNEIQKINQRAIIDSLNNKHNAEIALALKKNGTDEVSIFTGPPASVAHIASSIQKLSVCFPDMSSDFFSILAERIGKTGMSSKRLEYAINRVIDNFTYKRLTIADVLSIDVKCKILTYSAMCNEVTKYGCSTDDYVPIRIKGQEKPGWILKVDKIKYNIPDEL